MQKYCWTFKRKVLKIKTISESHPIDGNAEIDETVFGIQEESVRDRKNANKMPVVIEIVKKVKGVSRLYVRVIPNERYDTLGSFMKKLIAQSLT